MVPLDAATVPQVRIHADAIPAAPVRALLVHADPETVEIPVADARLACKADWAAVWVDVWVDATPAVHQDATVVVAPEVIPVAAQVRTVES